MKALLIATAGLEAGAGLALLASPPLVVSLLLGATLDTPASLVVARLGGAALLALGVACWVARDEKPGRSVNGLVAAMLVYNIAAAALFAHARLGSGLSGMGIWPGVVLHTAMAAWCAFCLRMKS